MVLSWKRLAAGYWLAYAAFQLWLAFGLTIDFNDAFEYLRYARRLAGAPLDFSPSRPPLIPLLHAPGQALLDLAELGGPARLVFPHLLQALLGGLLLALFYRTLRDHFSWGWAQAGTALLSLNRLVLHYFPCVLPDLPAALAALAYFRWGLSPGRAWLGGTALAACLLARWNLVLVPAAALAALAVSARGGPRLRLRAAVRALPLVLIALAAAVAVALAAAGWGETHRLIRSVAWRFSEARGASESPLEYAWALAVSAGPAALAAWAAGAAGMRAGGPPAFHGAFFLLFGAAMAFGIGHKESRYLAPALPSFYFTALWGLRWAWEKSARREARLALAAAIVLGAGVPAVRELSHFADPVYRSPLVLDLPAAVRAAEPGRVFWSGRAFSLSPAASRFAPGDDFYYFYHVPSWASFAYLYGEEPRQARSETEYRPGDVLIRLPMRIGAQDQEVGAEDKSIPIFRRESGGWRLFTALGEPR